MPYTLLVGVGREAIIPTTAGAIVAGGLVLGDGTTAAAQEIDFGKKQVRRLPDLPVAVHDTAGSPQAYGPLVIGGGNTAEQSVVQQWTKAGWHEVGHLPTTRSDLTSAWMGGKTYVLGGYDASTPAVAAVLSSPDGVTWTDAGSLAAPVRYAASAVANQKVWLFGGEVSDRQQDVVQTYDPAAGKGQVVAHLPMAIGHASAVAIQDRILILGGRTHSGGMTDQMWWFDPAKGTFTDAGRLPYVLADAAVMVGGQYVYVVGGESPHPISTILRLTLFTEKK